MISITSTLIQPSRTSPASVLPLMSLMSSERKTLASVSSSAENWLSKRKMTHVPQSVRGKAEHSERVLRSSGQSGVAIRTRAQGAAD